LIEVTRYRRPSRFANTSGLRAVLWRLCNMSAALSVRGMVRRAFLLFPSLTFRYPKRAPVSGSSLTSRHSRLRASPIRKPSIAKLAHSQAITFPVGSGNDTGNNYLQACAPKYRPTSPDLQAIVCAVWMSSLREGLETHQMWSKVTLFDLPGEVTTSQIEQDHSQVYERSS